MENSVYYCFLLFFNKGVNAMSDHTRSSRYNQKIKRKWRILLWILVPFLVIALGGVVYATSLYKKAETVVAKSYKPVNSISKRAVKADPSKDNISILFIGIDDSQSRNLGKDTRSDALMVATLNKKDKSVKLLSIPRDSYVHVPEKNIYTKITHAHAYGGTKLTIDTVQELLDIPIDYYVKMNFNAFMDVVNALGGIEVNVPYNLYEQDSKDRQNAIHLKKGLQTLNGEEALALARTRHYDSDIQRGGRQQEILKAIIKKAESANSLTKYGQVINAIGDNMETNMTFNDMKSLFEYALAGNSLNMESLKLEGTDAYINKIYYYKINRTSLANTKEILKQHLALDDKQNAEASTTNNINTSSKRN
jgi:LCP family protein required for cell wall assembly